MSISNMNFLERILYLLQRYGVSYLKGAGTTLAIALVSTAIGCLIGFVVGVVQTIPVDKKRDSAAKRGLLRVVKMILKAYVELFRGTPMIVQAVFIYYGLSQMFQIQLGMWSAYRSTRQEQQALLHPHPKRPEPSQPRPRPTGRHQGSFPAVPHLLRPSTNSNSVHTNIARLATRPPARNQSAHTRHSVGFRLRH